MVYLALLPLMRTRRLASSRLNWLPPADLNGLVLFVERRNLVSARVPSHFNWPLPGIYPGGGGKGGRCLGFTILSLSRVGCLETWDPQTPGNLRVCPDLSSPNATAMLVLLLCTGIAGWATHITNNMYKVFILLWGNKFRLMSPLLGQFAYFCIPCICTALPRCWLFYGRNM